MILLRYGYYAADYAVIVRRLIHACCCRQLIYYFAFILPRLLMLAAYRLLICRFTIYAYVDFQLPLRCCSRPIAADDTAF